MRLALASVFSLSENSQMTRPGQGVASVFSLHQARLAARYRARLPGFTFAAQIDSPACIVALPPADVASRVREIITALALYGLRADNSGSLAAGMLALPAAAGMTEADVDGVADALAEIVGGIRARRYTRAAGLTVSLPEQAA